MFNGKNHYKWPFSIAMLNYQRVFQLCSWEREDEAAGNFQTKVSVGSLGVKYTDHWHLQYWSILNTVIALIDSGNAFFLFGMCPIKGIHCKHIEIFMTSDENPSIRLQCWMQCTSDLESKPIENGFRRGFWLSGSEHYRFVRATLNCWELAWILGVTYATDRFSQIGDSQTLNGATEPLIMEDRAGWWFHYWQQQCV